MKLGILGDGQLALLLTEAFVKMQKEGRLDRESTIWILSPQGDKCPAFAAGAKIFKGDYKSPTDIEKFVTEVNPDRISAEITHFPIDAVEMVSAGRELIQPSADTFRAIQDKFGLKMQLAQAGLPIVDFMFINSNNDLSALEEVFGYPFILKTRGAARDGKGVMKINNATEFASAVTKLGLQNGLFAEKYFAAGKELSVIVTVGKHNTIVYPVTASVQKDNTCHITETPADVSAAIAQQATDLALATAAKFTGTGTYVIDMFLSADGQTLCINGVTPRVDNSCHYTIDGCDVSAYENNILALSGQLLVTPTLTPQQNPFGFAKDELGIAGQSYVVMLNMLGIADCDAGLKLAEDFMRRAKNIGGIVAWYGKEPKLGRKIGHVNFVTDTRQSARDFLLALDPKSAALMPRISDPAVVKFSPPPAAPALQKLAAPAATTAADQSTTAPRFT